jgi:hypothetical protein
MALKTVHLRPLKQILAMRQEQQNCRKELKDLHFAWLHWWLGPYSQEETN